MQGEGVVRMPVTNETRFSELYSRYRKYVHAYCARRVDRSVVADVVEDAFLVAWKRLDQLDDTDAALPWLYGIARRVILHQWRGDARARGLLSRIADGGVDAAATEAVVMRRADHDLVLLAASRLSDIDQEILRLEFWEGLSHADVAEVLDIKPHAIRQRAYRARHNLAVEFEKVSAETPRRLFTKVVAHEH